MRVISVLAAIALLLAYGAAGVGLIRIYYDAYIDAYLAGDVSFMVEMPHHLCCYYEPKIEIEI